MVGLDLSIFCRVGQVTRTVVDIQLVSKPAVNRACITSMMSRMMQPLVYLLLASLIPPSWAAKVIDFSLDVDHAPDSNGAYTSATLEKEDLPQSFTICAAYMVEAWTTAFASAHMFELKDADGECLACFGDRWGRVKLYAAYDYTEYEINLGPIHLIATTPTLYFPLQWTRVCLSLDTDSAMVRLVVDGHMLGQEEYKVEEDENRPANLAMLLGMRTGNSEYSGQVSNLNIFSSSAALSLERMVEMTTAGGQECGATGDYLSWKEVEWTLHSAARMLEVEAMV